MKAACRKTGWAHLFGGISKVDQRDVSALGGAYELLPGCHTVLTQPINLGGVTSNATMRGQIGGRTFAVPMKSGYSYLLKNTPPQIHDWARVFIAELDPGGAESQIINPATRGELDVCKQSVAGRERHPHPTIRVPNERAAGNALRSLEASTKSLSALP